MEVRGREGAIVDREIGQEFRTTQSLAVVGYLLIVKGRVGRSQNIVNTFLVFILSLFSCL